MPEKLETGYLRVSIAERLAMKIQCDVSTRYSDTPVTVPAIVAVLEALEAELARDNIRLQDDADRQVTTVAGIESFGLHSGSLDLSLELARCPFCGSPAAFRDGPRHTADAGYNISVWCSNTSCSVHTPEHYRTRDAALAAWNRRDPSPAREKKRQPVKKIMANAPTEAEATIIEYQPIDGLTEYPGLLQYGQPLWLIQYAADGSVISSEPVKWPWGSLR